MNDKEEKKADQYAGSDGIISCIAAAATVVFVLLLIFGTPLKESVMQRYGDFILYILLIFILAMSFFVCVQLLLQAGRGLGFRRENQKIMQEYQADNNAEKFYASLCSMKYKPHSEAAEAALNFNYSTALYAMGRYKESLQYIEKVIACGKTGKSGAFFETAEKQKEDILKRMGS